MAEAHVPNGQNLLLNALNGGERPPGMRSLELVSLELVTLGVRQILYEPDVPIDYVYFPIDGVHSMLAQVEEGIEIEVATVGNEGMTGLPIFLGTDTTPGRAFTQVPGQAYRLAAAEFKELIREPSRITAVLHRYTQALMVQISQGTGCNRIHTNDQRCARWLLQTQDRVGRDEFQLTQEFLAQMLGVRRATVSETAGRLQAEGMIQYSRGVIRITDRVRLEETSCACYGIVRREYDRMYEDLRSQTSG
jgi:CRP-like cAMP-binding protein